MLEAAARTTSGAVYPGVPTLVFGLESSMCLLYPKSHSLTSGRGLDPSSSVFSSLMSRLATPMRWQ